MKLPSVSIITLLFIASMYAVPLRAIAKDSTGICSFSSYTNIKLHGGINSVYFQSIKMKGTIFVGYVDYGTTGSHDIFLVTISDEHHSASIVPIGPDELAVVQDAPFDGDLIQDSIHFFSVISHGSREVILVNSKLNDFSGGKPNGSLATISVDMLKRTDDTPEFQFVPFCSLSTSQKFFDANKALSATLNVTLP